MDVDILQLLLDNGANRFINRDLYKALKQGKIEMAEVLLDHGGDVNTTMPDNNEVMGDNYSSMSLLMRAVANNDSRMVEFLISRGADISVDISGKNAPQ
jgi:ankyrin repeat protein